MGLAAAQLLHAQGHDVVIAGRSKEQLEQAVHAIGKAESHPLDATDEEQLARFFQTVGPFDHLVTTAADFVMGPFLQMPIEEAKRFFDSKFWGQYQAAKYSAPHMKKGGSITFFCGVAGQRPFPNFP